MSTLLLRLAAPLQSWGVDSKFNRRASGSEPSKSGVIGMIAAAMGRSREDPVDDLSSLRMGVRIDQPGIVVRDYHTAHHPDINTIAFVTERMYLSDAVFVVGLEGDGSLLNEIADAMDHPYYPLFLGRRSCPVAGRLVLEMTDRGLEESLESAEWQASEWYQRKQQCEVPLETVIESSSGGAHIRDVPISYSQSMREFALRRVKSDPRGVLMKNGSVRAVPVATAHDAFSEVRGD